MSAPPRTSRAAVLVEYNQPLEIRELEVPPLEPGAILVKEEANAAQVATVATSGVAKRRADAAFEAASLKAKALKLAYVQQTQGSGGETPLRVLDPAEGASSDRTKKLRLYLVVGALAGILAGVALATARAARRHS